MRLKELREEKNLTQSSVAQAIQTSQSNIGRWEKGANEPAASYLIKLANLFDVSIDYLLGVSDDYTSRVSANVSSSLSPDEKKIIEAIRITKPKDITDFILMYTSLPSYMQEYIFAELKGMCKGYKTAQKAKKHS